MTTATTTSVLPCSSYLSAQSQYLQPSNSMDHLNYYYDLSDEAADSWGINFGHSPECRSYAEAYRRGQYTFPECGISSTAFQADQTSLYPSQIPPGLMQRFSDSSVGFCCGNCSLDLPEVRLYYFPDSSAIDCGYNQSLNSTSISSARNLPKRVQSLVGDGSIVVVSGHTLYVKSSHSLSVFVRLNFALVRLLRSTFKYLGQ